MEEGRSNNKKRKKMTLVVEADPSLNNNITLETAKQELIVAEKRVEDLKCLIERLENKKLKKEVTNDTDGGEKDVKAIIIYKVLPHVLEWLDPTDVLTCVQVCKQFQYDIDNNPNIWKQSISNLAPLLVKSLEKRSMKLMKRSMKLIITKMKTHPSLINDAIEKRSMELTKKKKKVSKSTNNNAKNKEDDAADDEDESKSQNQIIDYKMIAKRLVYKPLSPRQQKKLNNKNKIISLLKPKDIIVIVEAKNISTGKLIGCWQQNFSKYKYKFFVGNTQRNSGIDMFSNSNDDEKQRKKKVIFPLGSEEKEDDDDSLSGDDDVVDVVDDDDDDDNDQVNTDHNTIDAVHSDSDDDDVLYVITPPYNIEFTIRLFRCDNSKSICFKSGRWGISALSNVYTYRSFIQRPKSCQANDHTNMGTCCEIHACIDPIMIQKRKKYCCMRKLSLAFDVQIHERFLQIGQGEYRRFQNEIPIRNWNDLYRSFDNLSWK